MRETCGAELRADPELTSDPCIVDKLLCITKVCGLLLCNLVPKTADTLASSQGALSLTHCPPSTLAFLQSPTQATLVLSYATVVLCLECTLLTVSAQLFISWPLNLSLNATSLERTYLTVLSELGCNMTFYMNIITVPCSFPS